MFSVWEREDGTWKKNVITFADKSKAEDFASRMIKANDLDIREGLSVDYDYTAEVREVTL
jgi:hypothetical protein